MNTDAERFSRYDKIITYAKLTDSDSLISIENENFPEDTEVSYNVVKDSSGRIIIISEYPFSQSGDWFAGFDHYFDSCGYTFAVEKTVCYYNSNCAEDQVCAFTKSFYDSDFLIIQSEYKLSKGDGIIITDENCAPPYKFDFYTYPNLHQLVIEKKLPVIK